MVFVMNYWLLDFIWLASYPRSGNFFVRTILFHCFGIKTGSIYPNDCGGNEKLLNYVGHLDHIKSDNGNLALNFPADKPKIIKTHSLNKDNRKAIYIIRDGRASLVSFYEFYNRQIPLKVIMEGHTIFGKWCQHVESWDPWNRKDTLLLSYEELTNDLQSNLIKISDFLKVEITNNQIPSRDEIAEIAGGAVRKKSNWREKISQEDLSMFNLINKETLEKFKYL